MAPKKKQAAETSNTSSKRKHRDTLAEEKNTHKRKKPANRTGGSARFTPEELTKLESLGFLDQQKLQEACRTLQHMRQTYKDSLSTLYNNDGSGATALFIMIDDFPVLLVSLEDIAAVLQMRKIENTHIEAWAIACAHQHRKMQDHYPSSYVFDPASWLYIVRKDQYRGYAETKIVAKLKQGLEKDVLIFPIIDPGPRDLLTGDCDHWSMLVFRTSDFKFRDNPRNMDEGQTVDHHFNNALLVAEFVDRECRGLIKKDVKLSRFMGMTKRPTGPDIVNEISCKKEPIESEECGVVVCTMMEQLISHQDVGDGHMTMEECKNYGAKMAEIIIDTPARMPEYLI